MKRILMLALILSLLTAILSGCFTAFTADEIKEDAFDMNNKDPKDILENAGHGAEIVNLLSASRPTAKTGTEDAAIISIQEFSLNLLRQNLREKGNVCISPLSVIAALGMTANGATGNTLAQLESAFNASRQEINLLFSYFMQDEDESLHIASSVWIKNDENLTIRDEYLRTLTDAYYGAGVFKTDFDDAACSAVNDWVKEHTEGRIQKIIDKFSKEDVLCLINALSFDAKWEVPYNEYTIRAALFHAANGNTQEVSMMYSTERAYLQDEHAVGFVKLYEGSKYAFAALLPEEGMSPAEYAETLDAEKLRLMLFSPTSAKVRAAMPAFESEYSCALNDMLKRMGITDLFSVSCDLSQMGSYGGMSLQVSSVLHKTYIKINGMGTEAGAATAVIVAPTSAAPVEEEIKEVTLDRPFLYIIFECETGTPIFMGAVSEIEM